MQVLRNPSPIKYLTLSNDEYYAISEESFLAFCTALQYSPLEYLHLNGLVIQTNNRENVVNALATAIVDTPSLTDLIIDDPPNTISADDIFEALSQTDAVRNFDLLITRRDNDNDWLVFRRSC